MARRWHDRVRTTWSGLVATVPARAMGEACPGRHKPRWQALIEGAAAPCRLAVAECEGPVRLQRRVRRVVDVAGRAVGPVPNAGHARVPVHPGLGEGGAD